LGTIYPRSDRYAENHEINEDDTTEWKEIDEINCYCV
jgi:hypothetical protein